MKRKRTVLISLIVAAACVVGGVVVAAAGLALGGFAWSALDTRAMVTREYAVAENFSRIAIDVSSADVVFVPAEDEACRVVCHDWEKYEYEVTVTADTLTVGYNDVSRWHENIFVISTGTPTVTVYLPKKTYASLSLHTSSGDVQIGGGYVFSEDVTVATSSGDVSLGMGVGGRMRVETISGTVRLAQVRVEKEANLSTSSGDLYLNETSCAALAITSSSGRITAEELTVEGTLAMTTTSGDMRLTAVTCGDLRAQSSSGQVDMTALVASRHMEIRTSSGDIRLTRSDAETLAIESTSGSVKASLLTDKIFYTETSSGSVSVPRSTEGGLCEITTSSGDIRVTVDE